jgi:hypothetical protein
MQKSGWKTVMPSLREFPEKIVNTEQNPRSGDIQEHPPRTLGEVVNAGVS